MSQYRVDSKFQPDAIFGIIMMVLSGLELLGVILIALVGGAIFASAHIGLGAGVASLLMVFLAPLAIVKFAAGYAMMTSRQWSFIVAIIFTVLSTLTAPWNLVLLVYSVLRISGAVGPKPS